MPMLYMFPDGDCYTAAEKKANDPAMTIKDNPLVKCSEQDAPWYRRNMRRLEQDAKLRQCPYNGSVYSGIMSTRFGG